MLEQGLQQTVGPDIGASGACVVINAQHIANVMVLEAGGKNIGGAVAACVGDQTDAAYGN